MFFKLFNWLVKKKRIPYTSALVLLCFVWAILVATFGALLVLIGADFEATGTRNVFLLIYFGGVGLASLLILIEYGILRLFGIKLGERKEFTALNDNIVDGHISPNISTEELSRIYYGLVNIAKWKGTKDLLYAEIIIIAATIGELFFSGQLTNVPIIFIGTNIAIFSLFVYAIVFHDTITSPARRECKILLAKRGIHLEEFPFLSLKNKLKFFIILIALGLLAILILIKPFNPLIAVLAIITLVIVNLLNDFISKSIYMEFVEIRESTKNLAKGREALFFSGSSDKEMFDLSQSLNETAQEISKYQTALEEEKASLEIKVKARTKELEELAEGLDQKVKERTKELQDRVDELERFHRLTVGRELKMVELKQKIKELEKKLGKNK